MATDRHSSHPRSQQPILVGRNRERRQLRDLLGAALDGGGSLVLVSGEAGIGKTSLVDNLIQEAEQYDCLVLTGSCYDLTTTAPYGPWSEALRHYRSEGNLPEAPRWIGNPDDLEEVGSQAALFEEIRRFLSSASEHQPLLIVLEDLHWSDTASLEALRYLGRTVGESSILLVATYRDDEITRRHELYQMLPLLVRESRAQRIHLNRLDRDDIHEIAAGRYTLDESDLDRLVDHVADRSEGNPFFAEEILHGLEDEQVLQATGDEWRLGDLERAHVPTLLSQALEFRLRHLSTNTRHALQVAAVIGQVVPIDLWREVGGLDAEAFEQAMTDALATRVLEETASAGTSPLQFRHALLREVLYNSLPLVRRRAWHRTVGELLAEYPNPDPDAVAHHFQESGDSRAAHWLIRAGVQAEASYALRMAARHYDTAQTLLDAEPDAAQARGWLLFHIGHLSRFSDRPRGLAHLEDALHVAQQVDDPALAAFAWMQQGLLRCFEGDLGSGLIDMERGHQIIDSVTSAHEQSALQAIRFLFPAEILSHRKGPTDGMPFFKVGSLVDVNILRQIYVTWLAFAGRFNEATSIGEQFVDQATAPTFGLATAADWLGQPGQAYHWRRHALNALEAIGHKFLLRGTQYWELQHLLRYQTDQVAERRQVTAAVIAANERAVGAVPGLPSRVWGLPLDLLEGRWDVARDLARVTLDDRQDPLVRDLRIRVFEVLRREQVDEDFAGVVQEEINEAIPDGPATEPGNTVFMYGIAGQQLAAHVALDRGDLDLARDWIEALDRWLNWSSAVMVRSEAALLWARYHRIASDLDAAREHAERALTYASNPRQPLALTASHRALGQLDTETGRYDRAAEHLQASLDLAERCAAPYEQALTTLEIAKRAYWVDDAGEARRLLRQARAIFETLGAERSLERANNLAARLSKAGSDYPAGLSAREVEVLEQTATGMTNTEIGDALFISRRTVAQHLRSIYNKLNVNSRTAAVARWSDLTRG